MVKKHILFIGGWVEPIKEALDLGFSFSYFGTKNDLATSSDLVINNAITYSVFMDYNEITKIIYSAQQQHLVNPFDAVFSFTENALEIASIVSTILNIKGLDLNSVAYTKNKDIMRYVLKDVSLSIPFSICSTLDEIVNFLDIHKKIIIKPINGAASVGAFRIYNMAQLNDIKELLNYPLLAEYFIDSDCIYTAETVSIDKTHYLFGIAKEHVVYYNNRPIIDYVILEPNVTEFKDIEKLNNIFLNKIKFSHGITHTEFMLDSKNKHFYLIESQTRVGGGRIWKMLQLIKSVSQFTEYYKAILLNENSIKNNFNKYNGKYIAILFFMPPAGKIKFIDIKYDAINSIFGVIDFNFTIKQKDNISITMDNSNHKGSVIIHASSKLELLNKISKISSLIKLIYSDNTEWRPQYDIK